MKMTQHRPWGLLNQLRQEMDQAFTDFPSDPLTNFNSLNWNPAVDIEESDESFVITADVPGIDPKELEVTTANGVVRISGERAEKAEDKKKGYHRVERSFGRFARQFRLPDNAALDQAKASCENGVLQLTIPKSSSTQNRRIDIN